jgi:hypothetical protein
MSLQGTLEHENAIFRAKMNSYFDTVTYLYTIDEKNA